MSSEIQSRSAGRRGALLLTGIVALVLPLAIVEYGAAQIHGIPPSVTSIQNHLPPYLPNARASVTSLGPLGWVGPPAFPVYTWPYLGTFPGGRGFGFGFRGRHGSSSGVAIAPIFVPVFDPSNGDDPGGGGPYMYSDPPAEQTPHIVVDTPPARRDAVADDDEDLPPPALATKSKHENYATPIDPTVLVFRDGHKQEVTNYAVMGQTIYVFDTHRQKIALGDLDVPATIKVNDDRGVEFQLPKAKKG